MDENIKNLVVAVPVVGFLIYMLNYFIKSYESEKKVNTERDKQDSKIIEGLKTHVEQSNKKHEETNKKHDETNVKIDYIIRKLDK